METQVARELAGLSRRGVSGTLEVSGHPGGTVYLSSGSLCFAESAAVPDLASRLTGSRRVSADQGKWLLGKSGPAGEDVGAHLLRHGLLADDELRALLGSITLDALVALAGSLPAETSVVTTRFSAQRPHWAASVLRLDPVAAWADAESKADRLARQRISTLARPQLRSLDRPWAVVERSQWAVACEIDGHATVRDLAWRTGLALFDVAEWVGDLARVGLCTLSPGEASRGLLPGPGQEQPGATRPGASSVEPGKAAVPPLPRRTPGASLPPGEVRTSTGPPGTGRHSASTGEAPHLRTHPELLRRVLNGLRRLT